MGKKWSILTFKTFICVCKLRKCNNSWCSRDEMTLLTQLSSLSRIWNMIRCCCNIALISKQHERFFVVFFFFLPWSEQHLILVIFFFCGPVSISIIMCTLLHLDVNYLPLSEMCLVSVFIAQNVLLYGYIFAPGRRFKVYIWSDMQFL